MTAVAPLIPPETRPELAFFVAGKVQTAGSKSIVPITKNGQTVGRRVVESGDRVKKQTWRSDLRDAAAKAICP